MFNNDAEINYMLKRLTNIIQLSVRQNINLIIINATDEQVCFFNICEAVFINIESIIVSISVFVVKRSDHEFFLKRFFQRVARINFININNKFFKIILHFLNDEKQMSFLRILTEHISNKERNFVFVVNSLNV